MNSADEKCAICTKAENCKYRDDVCAYNFICRNFINKYTEVID